MSSGYECIKLLGEGQYSHVYMARHVESSTIVALKKMKLELRKIDNENILRSALQEIRVLKTTDHKNIIKYFGKVPDCTVPEFVFEYMDTDLFNLINKCLTPFSPHVSKNIISQLLIGVEYLHTNLILHRDLKPANLLLNTAGRLKIADFGLSWSQNTSQKTLAYEVVTLWYRAPELLFHTSSYKGEIDIWSIGCILAEMITKKPVFPGTSEKDQLRRIFNVLGVPTTEAWPTMTELRGYKNIVTDTQPPGLPSMFPNATLDVISFLEKCWVMDPSQRASCQQLLKHEYFTTSPLSCADEILGSLVDRLKKAKSQAPTK
ncbi:hypothetical protein GCK72_023090 [Caenorhabditis remanei]|uniref:[RNA-polymerase]-subunit kinase n=1 Tax=Caenorhabditis remanei TaxID=31234 RepID=E3MKL3_CAERE|nr:hypothetical protein GCK72_023090 [Caenorhabditis remanei]EFP04137.1 hypothetical protein CRE_27629 [Caenorhabditis remanei]KAF1746633.1 hypothetical protein GCK72_023090 [Caenorhabditis remanei]